MTDPEPMQVALRRQEDVIEAGLGTFVIVGRALEVIRDGKLYRAQGHKTFNAYCRSRWEFGAHRGYQFIAAAATCDAIAADPELPAPKTEAATRALKALNPADKRTAWAGAVADANGKQPTARQVEAAVHRIDRPDAVPPIAKKATADLHGDPRLAWLDDEFITGDPCTSVTWRAATLADHEAAIRLLRSAMVDLQRAIEKHRTVISQLAVNRKPTLGDIYPA